MATLHTLLSGARTSPLRGLLISALIIVSPLLASETQACSCRRIETVGFLRAAGKLPSNALGVLYSTPRLGWAIMSTPSFTLIDSLPIQVTAGNFKIIERGGSTSLSVHIEEVNPIQNSQNSEHKIYYTGDKDLQTCIATKEVNACAKAQLDITQENWKAQLLDAKRLEDVTDLARSAGKLLRIRPSNGFVEGKQYTFQSDIPSPGTTLLLDQPPAGMTISKPDDAIQFSSETTIDITAPLSLDDFGKFAIHKTDAAKHQMYAGCGFSISVEAQMLAFEVPQRYEAYQRQLLYFTEVKFPNAESKEDTFTTWNYGGICPRTSPLTYNLGQQKETVYRICTNGFKAPSNPELLRVRGRIAFWEMSDQFFYTPEILVTFEETKNTACAKF